MRRFAGIVVFGLALMIVAGCSNGTSGSKDMGAGGLDLAGFPLDMARSGDMARTTVGIACGPTTACVAQAEECCSANVGKSGTCQSISGPCSGTNFTYQCDGPEDCPPAMKECCLVSTGASLCQDPGYCANHSGAARMCHFDSDCGSPEHCCAVPNSPYGQCSSIPCP
jgi:hypothetical protein